MATKKAKPSAKKTTVKKPQPKKSTGLDFKLVANSIKKIFLCKCSPTKSMPSISALVAEFIGAFLLVATIFAVQGQPLFVSFAIIGIVLIIAGASSAHINPAITIGAWVTRKICSICALGYIAAQALGATAGFIVLSSFLKGAATELSSAPTMFQAATLTNGKEWFILFAELLGTFIIALGVAKAIKSAKIVYSMTYGFATLVALIIAGSVTSIFLTTASTTLTFLNPAVAFTANAISWNMWPIAIYIIAPIIGGIAGFALNDLLDNKSCDCKDCNC
ncbi:MAG: aquaporin [Candidatus Saccharibacteria bacterium]